MSSIVAVALRKWGDAAMPLVEPLMQTFGDVYPPASHHTLCPVSLCWHLRLPHPNPRSKPTLSSPALCLRSSCFPASLVLPLLHWISSVALDETVLKVLHMAEVCTSVLLCSSKMCKVYHSAGFHLFLVQSCALW